VVAITTPLYASDCIICDRDVWLSSQTKDCFLDNVDRYQAEMDKSKLPYITMDFSKCPGIEKRGLIELPTNPQATQKSSFILDRGSLRCLYRLVSEHSDSFDPSVEFRLDQQCPDNVQ